METASNQNFKVSEIKLAYKNKTKNHPVLNSSHSAYQVLLENWDKDQIQLLEQFKIVLLNNALKVLGICEISSGGITATQVDIRLIFAVALKSCATAILLAHNHPSGNTKPSDVDISLTRKVKNAAALLDIKIVDHIIVTDAAYLSFADEGLL